jgi:hypothetical protein
VGTNLIVMATPIFDDHPGFLQRIENLAVEKFVAKLRVEAFAIAVFPRAARLDIGGLGADRADPVLGRFGDELGAVAPAEGAW